MKLIDTCAYLGHFPFRRVEHTTARELCADMDARGIDRAVVSSLSAVFYRDVRDGNRELFEEIAPYADRLIPAAVGNPVYFCALADLEDYVRVYHCREIRLYPRQHGYSLSDERVTAYLRRAAELSVTVSFPLWLEDPRQAAHLDCHEPVTAEEIREAALNAPETNITLYNADMLDCAKVLEPIAARRTGSFYYDFGRTECLYGDTLNQLIALVGADRILFATSQPLNYPEAAMTRLAFLPTMAHLSEEQMERIAHGNAERLFAL